VAKKRRHMKNAAKVNSGTANARRDMYSPGRRLETRVQLPAGKPDIEALRSVTREWLVPRLVEKFLRVHGIEPQASPTTLATSANRLRPSITGAKPAFALVDAQRAKHQ
jgi:hypothetical protein